jgi:hypothetical protein
MSHMACLKSFEIDCPMPGCPNVEPAGDWPPFPCVASQLTIRQREVGLELLDNLCCKEIAAKIGISVRMVEVHRAHLLRRIDEQFALKGLPGLTLLAVRERWIDIWGCRFD